MLPSCTADPEVLVKRDLRQLERLPCSPLRDAGILRTRARVACLKGDRPRAIQFLRESVTIFENTAMTHELGHDQYCLGLVLGGAEGAQLVASAKRLLSAYGISDPDANMHSYAPELMR